VTTDASSPQHSDGEDPAGLARIRHAQQRLGELDAQPVAMHIDTYDEVHAVLQDALADLDEA
jgi:hypothetical protein